MSGEPYVGHLELAKAVLGASPKFQYAKIADKASIAVSTSSQEVMRVTVAQPKSGTALVFLSGSLQALTPNVQTVWQVGLATQGGTYQSGTAQGQRLIDRFVLASQQSVSISGAPTGGTFTLTLTSPGGTVQTTAAIAYNATTGTVATALAALAMVGSTANVSVSGSTGGPYAISFLNTAIDAIGRPPAITATSSLTGGSSPAITVGGSSALPERFLHSGWRTTWMVVDMTALGNVTGTPGDLIWQVNANISSGAQMDFSAAAGTGASMLVIPIN